MTFWEIYMLVIVIIYLLAFFYRNLKTSVETKVSIRGKSIKLTFSIILSTIIYVIAVANIFNPSIIKFLGKLGFLQHDSIQYFGYLLILVALFIGLAALFEMKNSWRVGIKYDQKTNLVISGIYAFSRNPYFLSYDMLFLGFFLIYPSLILLVLYIGLVVTFHHMILEEEAYLEKVQGEQYTHYKKSVSRYFLIF